MSDTVLARFVGMSDPYDKTGAVSTTDGRTLELNGVEQELSQEEMNALQSHGVRLEVVGEGYASLKKDELVERLQAKGVDFDPKANKEELVEQLRGDSEASSPAATDTTSVGSGEGSAAGPDGPPPAGPAGLRGGAA